MCPMFVRGKTVLTVPRKSLVPMRSGQHSSDWRHGTNGLHFLSSHSGTPGKLKKSKSTAAVNAKELLAIFVWRIAEAAMSPGERTRTNKIFDPFSCDRQDWSAGTFACFPIQRTNQSRVLQSQNERPDPDPLSQAHGISISC